MEAAQLQIREQQKDAWNKFSPGWKKWDKLTMDLLKPMGDKIIQLLQLKETDNVLDIAAGTGEPGLTIAQIVNKGMVTSTDLSEGMMNIAKENAENRGLKNFTTTVCDVCELPFAANTFDAISCRMGFMFFPDMQLAANEMYRVLKPGGRIATSVWNIPEKNFWVTAMMGVLSKNVEMPVAPPGSPGMFRCAGSDIMEDIFKKAGFQNISETEVGGKLNAGTPDVYWEMMTEVAAPVVAALGKADDATKAKIKNEVFEALNLRYPDGRTNIDCSALVVYAEK